MRRISYDYIFVIKRSTYDNIKTECNNKNNNTKRTRK